MTRETNDDVPTGWVATTLGEPLNWASGGTPLRSRAEYYDGDIPWAIIGDLSDGPISETASFITELGLRASAAKWVKPGSVLLAMYGSIGKLGINTIQLTTNQAIAFTHPAPIDTKFLFYYLMSARAALISQGKGGTQSNISQSVIKAFPFLLAPLSEQYRIVSALESYFTRLDDAVATLERVQLNLKRYRASVLKAAVEGRLVPTEAELARAEGRSYEPASLLLERILAERRHRWEEAELTKMKAKGTAPTDNNWKAKYAEPVALDTTDLPELPEGWCWASVDQLVENRDRDRVPIRRADRAKRRGRYPYYGASGVIDTIDEFLFDGSFLLIGEDGANLLARSTPIAFQAHGKFWVNNHAHVVRTYLDLPLGYIEAFFNAADLARYVTGTAQPKLPQAAMNKIPVPLCPAAEQFRVVQSVELQLSIADGLQGALDATSRKCTRLRQSVLKWAFEGLLVNQDPTDEPASVLLERIRAERAAVANAFAGATVGRKSARAQGRKAKWKKS